MKPSVKLSVVHTEPNLSPVCNTFLTKSNEEERYHYTGVAMGYLPVFPGLVRRGM